MFYLVSVNSVTVYMMCTRTIIIYKLISMDFWFLCILTSDVKSIIGNHLVS